MFELSLSIKADKQKYLLEIHKKLSREIKSERGIITKYNHQGRCYVAIAVPFCKKEYYKSKILDLVVSIIINIYKYDFYKEHLLDNYSENVLHKSFLKAITIFDYEFDKEFIKNKIQLSGEICIDSFFFFCLQDLKDKWEKTVYILKNNNLVKNDESIIEIIKRLIECSESKVIKLDIYVGKNKITMQNTVCKKIFKNNKYGYSKLLSEIVKNNPQIINLSISNQNQGFSQVCEIMQKIYGDKIYF